MDESKTFYAKDRAAWRRWLQRNHGRESEVLLLFYRKATGQPCVGYDEAVREALCFGWIDGLKQRVDEQRYTYRFTPRRKGSAWSPSNKRRIAELEAAGLMAPAGIAVLEAARNDGSYAVDARAPEVKEAPAELLSALRKDAAARKLYEALPPGHQRQWQRWIAEAKKSETRERRAAQTIVKLKAGERRPS